MPIERPRGPSRNRRGRHDQPRSRRPIVWHAEALVKDLVDGDVVPYKIIADRVLRYPKVSFVYGLDL